MVVFLKNENKYEIRDRIEIESKKYDIKIPSFNHIVYINNEIRENIIYDVPLAKKSYLGEKVIKKPIDFSYNTKNSYMDLKVYTIEINLKENRVLLYDKDNEIGSVNLKDNDYLRINDNYIHLSTDNTLCRDDFPNYY